MAFRTLLFAVTVALVCTSSIEAYVLPLQVNNQNLKGDLAQAQAFRLAKRSLTDPSQGFISVPVFKRHGALHPDIHKRDPQRTKTWAFRQAEIMKSKFGASESHSPRKRQTIGLTDVGPDR